MIRDSGLKPPQCNYPGSPHSQSQSPFWYVGRMHDEEIDRGGRMKSEVSYDTDHIYEET